MTARHPTRARRAFTLVELLLVLALLVAILALAWPALRGPMVNFRLRDAASRLRVELAKTRLRAMESGHAWQFRYVPGSGLFQVAPVDAPQEVERQRASEKRSLDEVQAALGPSTRDSLPEGVTFAPPDDALRHNIAPPPTTSRSDVPSESLPADDMSPEPLDRHLWSSPVVFYPDGTATSTKLCLAGANGCEVLVTLRGLTGMSLAGDPTPREIRR